jgi:hypothetical protein
MKYTKQVCVDCSEALGFKLNDSKPKRCRTCRTSLLGKDPTQNAMYGRQHKDRGQFRSKNFNNVNYDDRIEEFSSSGNSRKSIACLVTNVVAIEDINAMWMLKDSVRSAEI